MQILLASSIFAIIIGIPNALVLVMLLNAWALRKPQPPLADETRAKHAKSLADGARIARNAMIFVIGAATFYVGLSLGKGLLDPAVIQLSLEGLLGALLPLVGWRWLAGIARQYQSR